MEDRQISNSQIFIARLNPRVTSSDLKYKFEKYGNVKEVRLKTGFAFVVKLFFKWKDFESSEDAVKAVEKMNGRELEGQKIVVEISSNYPYFKIKREFTKMEVEILAEETETEVVEETETDQMIWGEDQNKRTVALTVENQDIGTFMSRLLLYKIWSPLLCFYEP
jgi:RNA recognition motif-containing protein